MKIPDMNLLAALDVLLVEKSVARAASQLSLSTSAMSRTLARLRLITGDQLLVRAGRNMVLTPYAESIKERTRHTVFEARNILQPNIQPLDLSALEQTFTIRANDGFIETFASKLITHMAKHAPKVRLRFLPKQQKSPEALREGKVDLEIGVLKNMGPEIRIKALFYDHFVSVVRKGHPLDQCKTVTIEQYCQFSHIIASRRGDFSGPVDDELKAQGIMRHIAATVPSFPAALEVAKNSDLIALVPASFLLNESFHSDHASLWVFELPVQTHDITISMMWHPRLQLDSAHIWLREQVATVCHEAMEKRGF
ncbi:LysR family transcriptional regulator [Celerinatantimonas diazotrophica]|uniref:DNA-binding transcriptional LysR family regulator n=1 Tax=Celerinatantimonas diazotrophica TaxID=412034 RepID=A0A4R1K4G0_9GAMM|nr:LysR family transcriptional regulator [Celerinatantimonas diazotrophica]TCK58807.1 DNA-binding transcriptional LysR family regulator [Celerinatantimonas diazotrophica]CAG9297439.1 Nodulation protein D 2 [Celerinatantimonas diazotrophica]